VDYPTAGLTATAFDTISSGFGQWMVMLAVWLFAIFTMIAWSYHAE
jgi:AGCS family alanine or glycine:cation symporter